MGLGRKGCCGLADTHTLLIHYDPCAVWRADAGATTPAPPGTCWAVRAAWPLNSPFGVVCVVTDIDVGRLGLQGGLYDVEVLAVLEGACRVQHQVSASDDSLQEVATNREAGVCLVYVGVEPTHMQHTVCRDGAYSLLLLLLSHLDIVLVADVALHKTGTLEARAYLYYLIERLLASAGDGDVVMLEVFYQRCCCC